MTTKESLGLFGENKDKIAAMVETEHTKGIKNIFLIGCGGTYTLAMPWKYFADEHTTLPVFDEIAAELVNKNHLHLGEGSLCLFSSVSGDTKEIISAMEYCRQRGAVNAAILVKKGSQMEKLSDYTFYAPNDNSFTSFFCGYAQIMAKVLSLRGEFPGYERFSVQLYTIGEALDKAAADMNSKCIFYAARNAHAPWHMVIGSGTCWGEATCYAMCIMEEMQWIRTRPIHAAEFFHGTIELVEKDLPVIMMIGEDGSRPLAMRAYGFLKNMTNEILVFDSKNFALPVDEEFRAILSPAVMLAATEPLNKAFQTERNHDLAVRRFYRQMEY